MICFSICLFHSIISISMVKWLSFQFEKKKNKKNTLTAKEDTNLKTNLALPDFQILLFCSGFRVDTLPYLYNYASTGVASALNICVLVSPKSLDYIQLFESESF